LQSPSARRCDFIRLWGRAGGSSREFSCRHDARERFDAEKPAVTRKVVYVTDIHVGDATATRELMEAR